MAADAPIAVAQSPTGEAKYSRLTYGALTAGVLLFLVSCLLNMPANATVVAFILDVVITGFIWFVILAMIALIPAARRVNAAWLPIFAWLLVAAGVFDVAVGSYTKFVLEPQIRASLDGLIDSANRVAFPQKTIELKRVNYSLSYPADWSMVTEDVPYDPDHFVWLETPNQGFFQLYVFDPQVNASQVASNIITEFRDKQLTAATSSSFSEWGTYRGEGTALRGKLLSILPAEVRVFHTMEGSRTFITVEMCSDVSRQADQPGFDTIRKNLALAEASAGQGTGEFSNSL
ncbi:MAG: hypothetical protein WD738_19250 [Pirellulales bacterium]